MERPAAAAVVAMRITKAVEAFMSNPNWDRRYQLTGRNPLVGMDCSGFCGWILNAAGINLPASGLEDTVDLVSNVYTRNEPDPALGELGPVLSAYFIYTPGNAGARTWLPAGTVNRDNYVSTGWHCGIPLHRNRVAHYSGMRRRTMGFNNILSNVQTVKLRFEDRFGSYFGTLMEYLVIRASLCTIAGTTSLGTWFTHDMIDDAVNEDIWNIAFRNEVTDSFASDTQAGELRAGVYGTPSGTTYRSRIAAGIAGDNFVIPSALMHIICRGMQPVLSSGNISDVMLVGLPTAVESGQTVGSTHPYYGVPKGMLLAASLLEPSYMLSLIAAKPLLNTLGANVQDLEVIPNSANHEYGTSEVNPVLRTNSRQLEWATEDDSSGFFEAVNTDSMAGILAATGIDAWGRLDSLVVEGYTAGGLAIQPPTINEWERMIARYQELDELEVRGNSDLGFNVSIHPASDHDFWPQYHRLYNWTSGMMVETGVPTNNVAMCQQRFLNSAILDTIVTLGGEADALISPISTNIRTIPVRVMNGFSLILDKV